MENLPDENLAENGLAKLNGLFNRKRFLVIVKPNAKKTRIVGVDDSRDSVRIEVSAPASKGRANKELVRFLHKVTKKKVRIVKGLKSKEKLVELG